MTKVSVVLTNAEIYTKALPRPRCLLIEDGAITWMGATVGDEDFPGLRRIDLGGKWLAPAFVDAHVHLTNSGLILNGTDLNSCSSAEEMFSSLSNAISQDITFAHGWDDSAWEITLDKAILPSNDQEIYASRVDVHSAYVSKPLLDRCPEVRQAAGFHESGILTGEAHHIVRKYVLSHLNDEAITSSQISALKRAASLGIAAVHEMAGPDISGKRDTKLLKTTATSDLPEVIVWWGEFGGQATAQELGAIGCGGDLFVDGSIGSKTAALSQPYVHGDSGVLFSNMDTVEAHIHGCVTAGLATGFHAIGDAALELVINAYEHVAEDLGLSVFSSVLHQIEHAEMLSDSHITVMSKLGITASMQPVFDELWAGTGGMYDIRLGNRWAAMNNFAKLSREGVLMSFGSDSPVTPLDPWRAIRAATKPHNSTHAISARAAFAAHTRSSWRAIRRQDVGEIDVGMKANLALWEVHNFELQTPDHVVRSWSTDPRSATPELPVLDGELPRCLMTMREGVVIYSDGTIG